MNLNNNQISVSFYSLFASCFFLNLMLCQCFKWCLILTEETFKGLKDKISKKFVQVLTSGQANLAAICQGSRNKAMNFLRAMMKRGKLDSLRGSKGSRRRGQNIERCISVSQRRRKESSTSGKWKEPLEILQRRNDCMLLKSYSNNKKLH